MTSEAIEALLESLRYREDTVITNCFGEAVWLKRLVVEGNQIGLTDCCLVSEPCDHHMSVKSALSNGSA